MKWFDKLVQAKAEKLVLEMTGVDRLYHVKVREIAQARTYDGAPKGSVLVKAGSVLEPNVAFWYPNGELQIDDEVIVAVSRPATA